MSQLSRQEVYDRLIDATRTGVFPGYANGGCVYRDGEKRCAVGLFLRPEEPDPRNFNTFCCLPFPLRERLMYDTGLTETELGTLQQTHDLNAEITTLNRSAFPALFIAAINDLPIFANVVKVDPFPVVESK